jgi:hypothetical protein
MTLDGAIDRLARAYAGSGRTCTVLRKPVDGRRARHPA